tara:strand:- start:47 stop:640 length:594 start_codon:yes stop_codon:yes gene_type:complete
MKLLNSLKKLAGKHTVLLTAVAAVVLIYFVNSYSKQKGSVRSPMTTSSHANVQSFVDAPGVENTMGNCSSANAQPSTESLGQNASHASANGMHTNDHGLPPSCTQKAVIDPVSLLPKDGNSEFSKLNPSGSGDIASVSLLRAGALTGIDTVGQSLRNANLQLRSEPANPQLSVGPWHQSTITPDFNRKPLEIGCGSA